LFALIVELFFRVKEDEYDKLEDDFKDIAHVCLLFFFLENSLICTRTIAQLFFAKEKI
jgi:hypothetical protein